MGNVGRQKPDLDKKCSYEGCCVHQRKVNWCEKCHRQFDKNINQEQHTK